MLQACTAIGPLVSPNGITISSDARTLFVADKDQARAHELRQFDSRGFDQSKCEFVILDTDIGPPHVGARSTRGVPP